MFATAWFVTPLLAGLSPARVGALCAAHALNFSFPPFSISIDWFLFFPLLAAMAFGGRYAFIASIFGFGSLYPFFLWPNNGWANLATSFSLTCWFTALGYLTESRRRSPKLENHPYLVYPLSVLAFALCMRVLFPFSMKFNPPFWNSQAELQMPTAILNNIVLKGIAIQLVIVVFVDYLLKMPTIRKILSLEIPPESRRNDRIAVLICIGSLLIWFLFVFFSRILLNRSFPQGVFLFSDPHEAIALLVFLSAGIFIGSIMVRFEESRLKSEESLLISQSRLQLATSAGHIGIWDWNILKDELIWDDSMYSLYGLLKTDFSGAYAAWLHTLHPDDLPFVDAEIQSAIHGEREYAAEFRVVRPDGTVRIIQATSRTIRNKEGKAARMIGTNIDITEIRKEEEQRIKYEQQIQKKKKPKARIPRSAGRRHRSRL